MHGSNSILSNYTSSTSNNSLKNFIMNIGGVPKETVGHEMMQVQCHYERSEAISMPQKMRLPHACGARNYGIAS
jgi:hypothetical protein